MTKESSKKRGLGWFKGIQIESDIIADLEEDTEVIEEESSNVQNDQQMFLKDNQDKITLDLIVSMENMIKDRQLIQYKNKGLDEQLQAAHETINRLKQDQMKKEQLLQERRKEIRALEGSLTNKQMSYDQLLEDYKEYQNTSNMEYEKISNLLETETNKYNMLNEESMNIQYQNMLKINELEESIRNLEIENQQHIQQHQKILNEKNELMKTINDFTERMSFSFSQKTNTSDSQDIK